MKLIRPALLTSALALATSALAGSSPVGAWKGHIVIDASKMTLKDPGQIKMAKQQIAAAQKVQITLSLKADKTFVGAPPKSAGKWSQKGNMITLVANDKPGSQVFVVAKDGKSMTYQLPSKVGILTKIVLTR